MIFGGEGEREGMDHLFVLRALCFERENYVDDPFRQLAIQNFCFIMGRR
jgi:hypothetical protein